ncbi:glutamate synthase [Saccharibacillus sp. O23]|uniref:glutamate synthase subunit beta n=1 Tax=Saccharibacillus sp. O23 TaxID=2009338 RepID=UPI000B4E4CB5|nr:glutamate synthase subunit beta [Saccharibacillus sp. O23]OWR28485.1 glutamate synthase [Saccharibacillus sp. O23]
MGKATGFMEYERVTPSECEARERIAHWNEFAENMDEESLRLQAARCMDCGTPYCHAGRLLSGMAAGCPLNNLIPEWNDLVFRGDWRGALDRLHKRNNFPEFTGRVCPAACEGSCTAGLIGSSVTIRSLEKAIVDRGFAEGWIQPEPPTVRTGKKVAIVGSGPAGLACAAQLNKAGHSVTVYERADRIGGLLTYGIPNMKLDKRTVQRRVDLLEAEGVVFVTNAEVGRDIPVWEVRARHDAIVLAGGATAARDLNIEGRQLGGIRQAMDYLTASTKKVLAGFADERTAVGVGAAVSGAAGEADQAKIRSDESHRSRTGRDDLQAERELSAAGRDVVVIGGGDTGTDCVATALRQGCRSVVQLEIMPEPPSQRPASNPWPEYPRVKKTDYGQREAAAVQGRDPRRYVTSAKRFLSETGESVCGVQTVRVDWRLGPDGRSTPYEIPGSEQVFPAQLVLLALGFTGPEQPLIRQLELESDERSNVRTGGHGRDWASRGEAAARAREAAGGGEGLAQPAFAGFGAGAESCAEAGPQARLRTTPASGGSAGATSAPVQARLPFGAPSSPAGLGGPGSGDPAAFLYAASAEGVFAAGDMRRGQSLVAWAIREGREAAREVDRYLTGGTGLY